MKTKLICILIVLLLFLIYAPFSPAQELPHRLIVPDGQLKSDWVQVFVPGVALTKSMDPSLRLLRPGGKTSITDKKIVFIPEETAPNQGWSEKKGKRDRLTPGTLLLFDLSDFDIPYWLTGRRVLPILEWKIPAKSDTVETPARTVGIAVCRNEVYLSNAIGTIIWTLAFLVAVFVLIYFLTKTDEKKMWGLICTKDGRLSLSLTQMALWTLAVGSVVMGFAMMKLRVPEIPNSLLLLMVFATLTSTGGHYQSYALKRLQEKVGNSGNEGKNKKERVKPTDKSLANEQETDDQNSNRTFRPNFKTLLTIPSKTGDEDPVFAKAQMLFWTILTIIIFLFKTIGEGRLWDVPVELVFLMGISQAGFLGRKQISINDLKEKQKPKKSGQEEPRQPDGKQKNKKKNKGN